MKKIFLTLLLVLFLISLANAEYYIDIYADSVIGETGGVTVYDMGDFYRVNATNGDYEIDRALVMKWLFYGTDGSNPRATSTYMTNPIHVITEDIDDFGKRGNYVTLVQPDGSGTNALYTGTFVDTSNNDKCSSWSYVISSTSSNARWEMPSGTILNTASATSSDEIGTDRSADEKDNPSDCQLDVTRIAGTSIARVILFCSGNITWSLSGQTGSTVATSNDFYINENFPEFTSRPNMTLNNPENNSIYLIGENIVLNISSQSLYNFKSLSNITLYINGVLNETKSLSGTIDTETFTKSFSTIGVYNWSVVVCDNESICTTSESREFTISNYGVNSISIDSQAYETDYETYSINITPYSDSLLTSVKLVLNGTEYSTTKSGTVWSKSLDIPSSIIGTQNPYFKITYNGTDYNSENTTQTISQIQFGLCNATLTDDFLNILFKDEADLTYINASISSTWTYYLGQGTQTKSYILSSSTENANYSFCASPTNKTYNVDVEMNYFASTYPTRIWQPDTFSVTNDSTNQILYLLSQDDGIYSTFMTATSSNTPIIGTSVTAVRTISGENITVAQGTTDSSGAVTFWLNPNYDHIITASKTGYGSGTLTIKPTQSTYTIILSSELNNYTFVNDYEGLKWFVFPSVGIRNVSEVTNYGFNITAENDNIIGCKIELLDKSKTVLLSSAETIATNSSECSVQTSYAINTTYPQIKGRLLIDTGDGYQILEEDAFWRLETINTTGMTFTDWFNTIKELNLSYFNNNEQHREYTQILLFFLVVMIICAGLNAAGWDIQTSGGMIFVVGALIWMASIPGLLTLSYITPFREMDQFFLAGIYSMFMIGYAVRSFL